MVRFKVQRKATLNWTEPDRGKPSGGACLAEGPITHALKRGMSWLGVLHQLLSRRGLRSCGRLGRNGAIRGLGGWRQNSLSNARAELARV